MSSGQGKLPFEVVTDNNLLRQRYENNELGGANLLMVTTSAQGLAFDTAAARAIARQGSGYLRDVILFGDSLSEMNTWSGPTGLGRPDNGYLTWASALAGVDINVVRNAGIGGNTTTQMLARVDADVLAHPSDVVIEMSGINGISTIPVETQIANKIAIWKKLLADGRYVISMSTTPHSIGTDPTITNIASLNARASGWWRGRTDGEFVDNHPHVADTSVATAPWVDTGSYDTVHPTNWGAYLMAQPLVPVLKRLFAPRRLISSPRDALQYDPASKQLLPNPLFLGSGGGNGTGCSGTVAASWMALCGAGITAVHSTAPANSGCGKKQIINISASAAGYYTLYDPTVFSAAVVGDILTAAARIKVISGVNVKSVKFGVASQQSSIDWGRPSSAPAASVVLPSDFSVLAESYAGPWNSGSTYGSIALKVDFSAAGSATIEIEQAELRRR